MKKGIKQEAGTSDCGAAIAAMACETSIDHFKQFFGHVGPYSELHVHIYCLFHNRIVGVGGSLWSSDLIDDDHVACAIMISLKKHPAIVCVNSETLEDAMHFLYWDGKQVWDPNPNSKDGRLLSSYKVQRIFPVTKIDGGLFNVPVDSSRKLIDIFKEAGFIEEKT